MAYATEADLTAWNGALATLTDAERRLKRASELLDSRAIRATFALGVDGLPTDPDIADTLSDACCAQVEFEELGPGEEHIIEGMANRRVSIGHLSVDALPPGIAPRAFDILHAAGLDSSTHIDTTASRFFATQAGS